MKKKKPCPPSREQRETQQAREQALVECGWWPSDDGWRHRDLGFPWPFEMALAFQYEADKRLMSFDALCAEATELANA